MDEPIFKPKEVDLDKILESIGRVGKYQLIHFILVVIPVALGSIHANNYIFTAQDTEYRCKVPQCEGSNIDFDPLWLKATIPLDHCYKYENKHANNVTDGQKKYECSSDWFNKSQIVTCDEYIYKFNDSFIEEMNIPCEYWKRTMIGTLHSIGSLVALPLIGFISDRFGRRFSLVFAGVAEAVFGIARSLSLNYGMFAVLEFIEPLFGSGIHSAAYIIALELLLPSTRVAGGMIICVFFEIGQALMGTIAYLFPYWRTTLQVMYIPALLMIGYHWLIEESNRWLLSKGRYEEVLNNLKKMAKSNGKQLPEKTLENLQYNVMNSAYFSRVVRYHGDNGETGMSPLRQIIRSKILLGRMLKCSMWWITCTFCFYGLSINTVTLSGNMYSNFIIGAFFEIPGHVLGYFALSYFGRRKSIFTAYFIGGVCLLGFAFIPEDMVWLSLTAYFVGRLCVALAFGAIYLYTSELFPTPLRHSLLAACSMIGRIGSITAPQTPLLALYSKNLPSYLFAGTCLASAILALTTPETINQRLPETIHEAENISTLRNRRRNKDESPN